MARDDSKLALIIAEMLEIVDRLNQTCLTLHKRVDRLEKILRETPDTWRREHDPSRRHH